VSESGTGWQIHHGDCLDVMKWLDAGSVDAIVTDPPYGLDFRGADWDAFIPAWLDAARRVCRGPIVFTTAPTTMWDYPRPDWVLSCNRPGSTSRTGYGGFNHWTPALVYGRGSWTPDTYTYPDILRVIENAGIDHPCPKPVGLARWLIRGACEAGATVLDPFMGSGTTGIAAIEEGCRFIGIEKEADYVAIARARIDAASRQGRLFA
jgi:DNA modification methylase